MREKLIFFSMMLTCTAFHAQYQGRVGINTDKPEQKLHVNGTMKATNIVLDQNPYTGEIPELDPAEGYSILLKSTSANRITTYNIQSIANDSFPAPFGVIQFNIDTDNNDRDWINAFDTRINASKYIAVINSFNYNLPVVLGSSSNAQNAPQRRSAPVAQVYTYEQNGTWWIKADYHGFAPPTGFTNGKWTVNLMVFDKVFARPFPATINMNGNSTGAATLPLLAD